MPLEGDEMAAGEVACSSLEGPGESVPADVMWSTKFPCELVSSGRGAQDHARDARYDASSRVSCGGRHRGRKAAGKAACRRIVTPRSTRVHCKDPLFEFAAACFLCKQALSRPACRRPRRCDQRCPYFFSQFDYKMSMFTGRLALTVWRKEAPRAP